MGLHTRGVVVSPVRRDSLQDAEGVARVLNAVIAERRFTALTGHWTAEAEQAFLQTLGPRSEMFVARLGGRIVGFQIIEAFVTYASSMDHVAHFGTYVEDSHRGRGIGRGLAAETLRFAKDQGYEKAVVYVLSGNDQGLAFYRSLGFEAKGRLTRQTKIDGVYHDEVFMESFFEEPGVA